MAEGQSDEIKKIEVRHNSEIEDKNNEIRDLRQNEIAKLKEEVENYQETMGKRYTSLEMEKEKSDITSRQKLKNTLDRQRTEFGRTINQIDNSNKMAISDLRDEMSQEQSKLIESTKEEIHNKLSDMKTDYETIIQKKESSQDQKIAQQMKENELLTQKYEQKIDTLKAKSAKELASLKKLEQDRRVEDQKANERTLATQRREFQKTMMSVKRDYDRRLDRSKANADVHVAKLTQRYENLIHTERSEHSKELQRKDMLMKSEFNRLADQSKIEKNSIINQYESKLNKLREANRVAQAIQGTRENNEA